MSSWPGHDLHSASADRLQPRIYSGNSVARIRRHSCRKAEIIKLRKL